MSERRAPGLPLLIPNLAAEEGAVWETHSGETVLRDVARLWAALFPASARLLGEAPTEDETNNLGWPVALGPAPEDAALSPLETGDAYAWLHDARAQQIADEAGLSLAPPMPDAVARLHDKAFAQRWAAAEGRQPEDLRALVEIFDPEELLDEEPFLATLESLLAGWPAWTGRRFTLKPRFGSSGRGRATTRGAVAELAPALPRLAERGGAVLEPWLERVRDLSAQFWIEPGGTVRLLGTLELLVSPAGVYRGHRGSVDNKGRITSLCPEDEALREAAAELAVAAATEGFSGPCAVDAFTYRSATGEEQFRPVVEFNARFTLGTVAVGLLHRALPRLRTALPRDAGERRAFFFALAPPDQGWPSDVADERLFLPLTGDAGAPRAALVVARDSGHLEVAFQGPESASMLRH